MNKKNQFKEVKNIDVINLYHLNKNSFPKEIVDAFEKNYDGLYFMFNVLVPFLADLPDLVKELMMKHYPVFKNEKRPTLIKEMDLISTAVGVEFISDIAGLMNLKRKGKTIREHFNPFDQWVKDRTYPEDTWEEVRENDRGSFGFPEDDEEWEEIKKEENAFREMEVEWIKKRRFEFIDLLQSTLLRYFKGFEMLSSDDLMYYSILLRSEYEYFWEVCERIEDFIDWGLSEEDFALNFSERLDKTIAMGNEKRWEVAEMRYRRVYGEEV